MQGSEGSMKGGGAWILMCVMGEGEMEREENNVGGVMVK